MELKEAIEYVRAIAEGRPTGDMGCTYQYDELADWLEELEKLRETIGEDYSLGRLKEIVGADKDGRCVVLPCKDGDEIFVNGMKYRADHWNIYLTAFNKPNHDLETLSVKDANLAVQAALEMKAESKDILLSETAGPKIM